MSRISMAGACTTFCTVLLMANAAPAVSPADKCESSELKTSGKYSACRLKADAKAVKTGGSPDFSKCDATLADKFGKADMEGMGSCPSSASQAAIQAFITQCTGDVATALAGGPLPNCQPPPLKTGQTTAYGIGSDGDLQKGASQTFTDNGDGTIIDNTTGLMWEKKDSLDSTPNVSDPHDADNLYTWCADVSPIDGVCDNGTNDMDGTIVTTFLAALNAGSGFAGHTDWRIPNVNELQSIVNYQHVNPAVDTAFNTGCAASCTVTTCSCTQSGLYWSSTTYQGGPPQAWFVHFSAGSVSQAATVVSKPDGGYVRAVRGSS